MTSKEKSELVIGLMVGFVGGATIGGLGSSFGLPMPVILVLCVLFGGFVAPATAKAVLNDED